MPLSELIELVIKIFPFFKEIKKGKLKAKYSLHKIKLPDNIDFKNLYFPTFMSHYLANGIDYNEFDDILKKHLIEHVLPDYYTELSRYNALFKFIIDNKGTTEITNLQVECAFDGYYCIERDGDTVKKGKFTKDIKIDMLRPVNKLIIYVWTEDFNVFTKDIRITYPDGFIIPKRENMDDFR